LPYDPNIAADAAVAVWGPQPFSLDIALDVLDQRDELASVGTAD
jgi:hypothetical protein